MVAITECSGAGIFSGGEMPAAPQRFQLKFEALLPLIYRDIYSLGPEVAFREILQNAVDAIITRRRGSVA